MNLMSVGITVSHWMDQMLFPRGLNTSLDCRWSFSSLVLETVKSPRSPVTTATEEKKTNQSFATSAAPLCAMSGEAQVTRTPQCGHASAVRGGRKEGACGFLSTRRAEAKCVSSQMDSHTKTGKVYLQPHKAGKVSPFKRCCRRVSMIHSESGSDRRESCRKTTGGGKQRGSASHSIVDR